MRKARRQILSLLLALALLVGGLMPSALAAESWESALTGAAAQVGSSPALPGSVGGEWAVIGLVRGGQRAPEGWLEAYYAALEEQVTAQAGVLSARKYTEYARTALAVTALGKDPRNVAGYDLLAPLGDFDKTVAQGLNGAVFALLALDCGGYPVPEAPAGAAQASRAAYVEYILSRQLADGGWALSGERADPDMTAMALQALAPYCGEEEVAGAAERGTALLTGDPAWAAQTAESAAQSVIALCAQGIAPSGALVDGLLAYRLGDGSFCHAAESGSDRMATEQALCALAALSRMAAGQTGLYDMTDLTLTVRRRPVVAPDMTFSDIQGHPDQAAIEALACRGIVAGTRADAFEPDAGMTRAEFATMVVAALGLTPQAEAGRFDDVPDSAWYAPFVGTAVSAGITAGTGKAEFAPEDTIPLQQAAVMVAQAARLCGLDTGTTDAERQALLEVTPGGADCADWAATGMAFCLRTGILTPGEPLDPEEAILRCDMARMLYRLLERAELL